MADPFVKVFWDDRALQMFRKDVAEMMADVAGKNSMRQPLLKIARNVFSPSIDRNFAVGGRPDKWAPVAPESTYRQERSAQGSPPLWVTGKLKRSAAALARWHVQDNVLDYGRWPPTLWYGPLHDLGPSDRAFPARPFALIQAEDAEDARDIMWDWYESKVNQHIKLRYAPV